jgi:hypothetical protein
MKTSAEKNRIDILHSGYPEEIFPRSRRQLSVPVMPMMSPTKERWRASGRMFRAHLLTNFDDTPGLINIPVQNVR